MTAFTTGLRARLLLLVLLAVVPAIGLIFYSAFSAREQAAANAQANALNLVHLITQEQNRLVTSTKQFLVRIAKEPEFSGPANAEACNKILAQFILPRVLGESIKNYNSSLAELSVAAADGRVFCTGRTLPVPPVSIADRSYFQRALKSRDVGVSGLVGRPIGKNVIGIGQAVLDRNGNVKAVVCAILRLTWLNHLAASYDLPAGSVIMVLDNDGTVRASGPDFESHIGTSLHDTDLFRTIVTRQSAGAVEATGPDAQPRFYVFAPWRWGPDAGVYMLVGIPRDAVFAAADKELIRNLAILLLVAIFTMAVAWIGGDVFVLKRIRQLESEVQRRTEEITRAKEEVEKASAVKSHFFAAANHDLRQPLHALALLVEVLSRRVKQQNARPLLKQMRIALGNLESTFEAVVNINELESGKISVDIQSVPVAVLFERLKNEFELSAQEKGLTIKFRAPTVAVWTDAVLLQRILSNLISNAIKYSEKGGILVACRLSAKEKIAKLQIFDTGIGIADTELPRIFEDFYQTPTARAHKLSDGTGLGLGIVQRLSQRLDHPIDVRSRPNRGSRFTLRVALDEEWVEPVNGFESEGPAEFSLKGRSILVVDDEDVVLNAMQTLLRDWGAQVMTARSSTELDKVLKTMKRPLDFLIADYQLEPCFSGEDVIRKVRQHTHTVIPCAVITGNVLLIPAHVACIERVEIFAKPVQPAKLRTLLHSNLDLPSMLGA